MTEIVELRRFRVQAGHHERHHAVIVEEASFEAAVVAYIENHPAAAEIDAEMRIIVRDLADGREHCFRIDLETGETTACG